MIQFGMLQDQLRLLTSQQTRNFHETLLENKNSLAGLEALLKKLLSDEDRGFITGEERRILFDRGVKENFVNLITKESLKDLTLQNLLEDKLFLISFTETMLNDKPDFIEKITENGVILTSTGAESKDGFVYSDLRKCKC